MPKRLTRYALITIFLGLVLATAVYFFKNSSNSTQSDNQVNEYQVSFHHRGSKQDKPENGVLKEYTQTDEQGKNTVFYAMDVRSVFCGENVCNVDIVTLYWNRFGEYQSFELAPNVKLEKNKDLYFDQDDYRKLHASLSNERSGLRDIPSSALVVNRGDANSVDASTGATVSLNKNDYVEGAIWTCYTLWHYAHGDIVNIIRNLYGNKLDTEQLLSYLTIGKAVTAKFALEQLIKRSSFNEFVWLKLREYATQTERAPEHLKLIFDYLALSDTEVYFTELNSLVNQGTDVLRLELFRYLSANSDIVPAKFVITAALQMKSWQSYHVINAYFDLLEKNHVQSTELNSILANTLDSLSLLAARRIYWYLLEQAVSTETEKTLVAFAQKHSNQL